MRAIINNQEQDTKTTIKGDVNIEEGLSGDNCSVTGNKSTETMSTIRSGSGVGDTDYKNAHIGRSREYWRDMILGVNDGLVSTFLLVAGVYGSGLDSRSILLTAISGMIAGAISMAGGEYVATKTQGEVMKAECDLEQKDIKEHKSDELRYLSELLETIGIPETESIDDSTFAVRRAILEYYKNNDDAHLRVNVALAFGSIKASERSPLIASVVAFFLFIAGSLTSVIPFVLVHDRYGAMVTSFVCTILAILVVGGVKTWATKGSWWISAFENFIITSGGGAVAYGIGLLFGGTF